jgi:hypothetical protein
VTIQGKSISVSSSEGLAAIDTGTTLIGAPSDITTEIWSNVPGSVALTGQYQGMYSFRTSLQFFAVFISLTALSDNQHAPPPLPSPSLSAVLPGPSPLMI